MTSSETSKTNSTISIYSDEENSGNTPQYELIDISKVIVDKKNTWFYTYEASFDNLRVRATKPCREGAKLEAAQKLLSIIEKMKSPIPEPPVIVENFKDVLQTYCTNNNIDFPFYKTTSIEPHRNTCHCHVLVPFDNRKEFLVVIAYGTTKELAEEEAAKTMKKRLTSLLTVPAMIVQQKNIKIEEEKEEEEEEENKHKKKSPSKPIIQSSYYDDAENDNQYSLKSSITSDSSSSSESSKSSVENSSVSNKNFGAKKKHHADVQLEKIQQLQHDYLNLMPRETASKMIESVNEKERDESLKKVEKKIDCKKVKKTKAVAKKRDYSKKNSDEEKSNEPRILSEYYNRMVNIFGYESRRHEILQEITKLNLSVIEFETKHMQIIDRSSTDSRNNSFPFQSYINHLDSIMLHVNVGVESSIFVGHDGQFIRVIRVTTLPEIVEVEIGPNADRVGVKAFYNVIEKIRKLMS